MIKQENLSGSSKFLTSICRNMVQRRSDAAACVVGGKMYVAGGYTGESVLQTVEMYIPEMDIWTEIAHMNSPRSGIHPF